MSVKRTFRQRCADYKRTFPRKVNDRRWVLIEKEHAGFTEEESLRSFVGNPGWKAECEGRLFANLTDDERAELAECERVVDAWQAGSPWAEAQRAWMDEMKVEIERRGPATLEVRP